MTNRSLWALVGIATLLLDVAPAHADENAKPQVFSCQVGGETTVQADTAVYDLGSGGKAHAKLTGAKVPLTVTHFPNPLTARVRVSTSTGKAALRIDGWIDHGALRFFAARDLPAIGSHVWITKGQQLTLTGASSSEFAVTHGIMGTSGAKLSTKIPCDAVSLQPPSLDASEPPKNARTYQMKNDSIDLYDEPGGQVVFTLALDEGTRKVFWSTESRAGYLHVMSRADITIDAWVKYGDVTFLRHAELFDLANVTPKPFKERKLTIADPPAVVIVPSEVPIHAKPENSPTSIGALEAGARIYPMEVSGDWTNVMPESLAVLPAEGRGFWVRTSGLPTK